MSQPVSIPSVMQWVLGYQTIVAPVRPQSSGGATFYVRAIFQWFVAGLFLSPNRVFDPVNDVGVAVVRVLNDEIRCW